MAYQITDITFSNKLFILFNRVLLRMPNALRQAVVNLLEKLPYHWIKPSFIMIEPTNSCNFRCPLCPTLTMKRQRGFMKLKDFKKIIDEVSSHVKGVVMNFAGETLLNKDVYEMIEYAESQGIRIMIGTNGSLADADKLIESRVSGIIFALDGTTKDAYEKYRYGGNFNVVVNNIKAVCDRKRELKLKKPEISLQFIVMKHNEHQVKDVEKLGEELGVDKLVLKTVSLYHMGNSKEKEIFMKKYLPTNEVFSRYRTRGGIEVHLEKPIFCQWLFQSQILYNGDVTTCCYDNDGKNIVGNIFSDGGFFSVWKSKRYRERRKEILKRKNHLCATCSNTFIDNITLERK